MDYENRQDCESKVPKCKDRYGAHSAASCSGSEPEPMFTTVRKSLGFIAPVIPNGKHLQQTDPGVAGGVASAARNAYGGVFSTKDKQSSSLPDKVPQQSQTFGTIQDMVVKKLVFCIIPRESLALITRQTHSVRKVKTKLFPAAARHVK
jgi:hypothetical protein